VLFLQVYNMEFGTGLVALDVSAAHVVGSIRVFKAFVDSQSNVHALRVVAQAKEHVPEGKAVLPTRNRNEQPAARVKHLVALDGSLDHGLEPVEEMWSAQPKAVLAHVDDGSAAALVTFQ
jgi:hypothetical protein